MSVTVTRVDGPVVSINCPACGGKGVASQSFENRETAYLIIRHRTHWVTCGTCGETLFSKLPAEELARYTPQQLEQWVVQRPSLPGRLLAILSMFLFFWPILGPMVSFASWMANLRRPKVARRSMILFVVGGLITVATFVMIAIDEPARSRR